MYSLFFFFKQKTAYEMRISDWSSDVCSSDLLEFEGTLIPWKGMTIEGSAAYLHARYEKGSRFENQLVGGELVEVDRSGEPITQAPKRTASIGATQEFEFEAVILKLHADYAYIASRYFDYFTTGDPAQEEAVAIANEPSC